MVTNNSLSKGAAFLEFLPISFFGGVMGLSGLCFSWRLANQLWHFNNLISEGVGGGTVLAFVALTMAYWLKWRRNSLLVRQEFDNPVSISFFATFIISLLLIPGILLPYSQLVALVIWSIATVSMMIFALYVLRKWIDNQQFPENAMPAWVLPIVGTLDVPIVGTKLPFPAIHEICLMFFGIGLLFSFVLITIILGRLFFQKPLTEAAQPTLLILTGPFALAFTGYEGLIGTQDIIASGFFYFDLFLLILLGSKIILLPKCCPFRVSWWSVSFPLTAITVAAFNYESHEPDIIHEFLAGALLAFTTTVILYLVIQTLYRIWSGTFSYPVFQAAKI